ncbi:MAG: glycosyltransferase [Desulfurivibrionaceae bacterium]
MKISIITPSYNQVGFLEKAILSVWNQKGDFDLEHIVADGGSTDGSLEILRKYDDLYRKGQFKHSCRSFSFSWWHGRDNGQSDAINTGFAASKGEILGWLNSDDIYLSPGSLAALQQPFLDDRADIAVGNGYHIGEHDNILKKPCLINLLTDQDLQQRLNSLICYDFILQPATLFRREVWLRCPLDESCHFTMDWVFWIEANRKEFRFSKIDFYAAGNRLHEEAKTVKGGIGKYREALKLFRRYDVWCMNRIYYFLYLILLCGKKVPLLNHLISPLIHLGKKVRNFIVNRFRLY